MPSRSPCRVGPVATVFLAAAMLSPFAHAQPAGAPPPAIPEHAEAPMPVLHESNRTWIDVPGFDPGLYASSVHGAQARILQTLGERLTYDDLVVYGGFAFRAQVHKGFCPSAGHPCCGYECVAGSQRALPWRVRTYAPPPPPESPQQRQAFEAEVRAAVKASIDRGIPVHYGSEEDGLIIGYADGGNRWLCRHPYHNGGRVEFWHDEAKGFAGGHWPWGVVVWVEPLPPDERPAERDLTHAALRQAVDMWRTPARGDYLCGEAAYEHWLTWLHDVEAGRVPTPGGSVHGSGWCFDVLAQNRRIAARWLAAKAAAVDGEAAALLAEAAGHYRELNRVCLEGLKCPWDLSPPPEKWTSDMRQQLIRRLEAARQHDRAAIAAIERALPLLDPPR